MKYIQSTGQLFDRNGKLLGTGWAGNGLGKNNPSMQNVHDTGPLPCGWYIIGAPVNSAETGIFTLPLTPYSENEMYGRSDFKIHGHTVTFDKDGFTEINGKKEPISKGCIIQEHDVRVIIWNLASNKDINIFDNELEVTKN